MFRLASISIILKTYALILAVFTVFRGILFSTELRRVDLAEEKLITLQAFLMGVRFDIVITSYILFIPAFLLFIFEIFGKLNKPIKYFSFWWSFLLFSLAFFICGADIPYFNHFFSRITISSLNWVDNADFVSGIITQDPQYIIALALLAFLLYIFYKALKKIFSTENKIQNNSILSKSIISLLFLGLMFLGIRGRLETKSPIRIGTAYFSDNAFLNQMGLNPVFTFFKSYLQSRKPENQHIRLMDDNAAVQYIRQELDIDSNLISSPIARMVYPDSISKNKKNVVIIIMESMSAAKLTRHGNPYQLTPFLDSLLQQGIYFENAYTAGKHSYNGIFSTFCSFPALYSQHALKRSKSYNSIAYALKKQGYSSTYFCTHDAQFDNTEGFLRENHFDDVMDVAFYPQEEVKTQLGVPDDIMFETAIPYIDKLYENKKPFFVSLMTTSDHRPFYIPEYFKPKNKETHHQIVEYADWSLKKFMALAQQKEWFDNTIFVFVADHGSPISAPYEISLDYHHTPLLFYSPTEFPTPSTYKGMAGQVDIFPSVMGILDLPYLNNHLGVDLFEQEKKFTLINDDDKIGILDSEFLLIMKPEEASKLYRYRNKDRKNYASEFPALVLEMEQYAKANLQVYQNMFTNNQLFVKDENVYE